MYCREIEIAQAKFGGQIQLVFLIVPKGNDEYEELKYLADIELGIASQGIAEDKFMRPNRGYHNLFTFQINAKLNGRNIVLERGQFQKFTKEATMVIGADVCHAAHDSRPSDDKVVSSIAAVVGSYDRDFSRYVTKLSAQPPKMEYLTNFDEMVAGLLNSFAEKNPIKNGGVLPRHIVFFRDGVSESQLDKVKEEISLIDKAYDIVKAGFKPKITALVVQKRHHTRFVPTDPGNNKGGNVAKGTYVDNTITNPLYEDSFLFSHDSPLVSVH